MNTPEFIQSLAFSGALGYLSLSWLQNHGTVTKYLSKSESTYKMVIFGVIDYLIYLVSSTALNLVPIGSTWNTIISLLITALLVTIYTAIYSDWLLQHSVNKHGFQLLTTRESAFTNPDPKGQITADVFKLDGTFVTSGFVREVNFTSDVANDVSLIPLTEGYRSHKTIENAQAETMTYYIDTNSKLIYYLTYY